MQKWQKKKKLWGKEAKLCAGEQWTVNAGNPPPEKYRIKSQLKLGEQSEDRTQCVCVIIHVCFISAAVWLDLGLFAVSSCSDIPASCKIKWRTAHAHSKSEIAGPLCSLCV